MARKSIILLLIVVFVFSSGLTATTYAQCEHQWDFKGKNIDKYNDAKHKIVKYYDCISCGESKTETEFEEHSIDKYGKCDKCKAAIPETVTLLNNKVKYVNRSNWIKLIIKKKGYIVVDSKQEGNDGYGEWSLYSKNKAIYLDHQWMFGAARIPVKKGTYYMRVDDDFKVKYTFKKDPSKKNYTKKKATKIKKNRNIIGVLYPTDKKKTWTRYYKFTLSKKQFVKISVKNGRGDVYKYTVLNKKGKKVPMEQFYDATGYPINDITSSKLKKGTYYIKIQGKWSDASKKRNLGLIYTVKWF